MWWWKEDLKKGKFSQWFQHLVVKRQHKYRKQQCSSDNAIKYKTEADQLIGAERTVSAEPGSDSCRWLHSFQRSASQMELLTLLTAQKLKILSVPVWLRCLVQQLPGLYKVEDCSFWTVSNYFSLGSAGWHRPINRLSAFLCYKPLFFLYRPSKIHHRSTSNAHFSINPAN